MNVRSGTQSSPKQSLYSRLCEHGVDDAVEAFGGSGVEIAVDFRTPEGWPPQIRRWITSIGLVM